MRDFVTRMRGIDSSFFTQEGIHEAYQVAEYAFNSAKDSRKIEDREFYLNIGWAALNGVGFRGVSKDPLRKANAEEKLRATKFMLLLGAMDDNHIIVRASEGACEAHQQHYDYLRTVYLNGKGKKYNPAFSVSPLVAVIVSETEIEEFISPFRFIGAEELPLRPFDNYTGYKLVRNVQSDSLIDFTTLADSWSGLSEETSHFISFVKGIDKPDTSTMTTFDMFWNQFSSLISLSVIEDLDMLSSLVTSSSPSTELKDRIGGVIKWGCNTAKGYFSTLNTLSTIDTSALPEEVSEEAESLRKELEGQFIISSLLSDSDHAHNYSRLKFLINALKLYVSSEDALRAKNAGLIFTTLEAIKSGSIRGVREYSIYRELFERFERVVSTSISSRAAGLELDPETDPYRLSIDLSYTPPTGGAEKVEIKGSLIEFWDSLLKTESEYFYHLCQRGDFSPARAVVELLAGKIGSYTQRYNDNLTSNLFEHEGKYWTLESLSAEAFALAYADWLLTSSPDVRARFGGDQLFFLEPYRWVESLECSLDTKDVSAVADAKLNNNRAIVKQEDKNYKVYIPKESIDKTPEWKTSITRMHGAFKHAKYFRLPVYTSVMHTGQPGREGHYVTLVFEPKVEADKLTIIDPFGDYEETKKGTRITSEKRRDRFQPLLEKISEDLTREGINITETNYIASGQQESPNSCGIIALLMAQKIAREGILTDSNFMMEPWNDGLFSEHFYDSRDASHRESYQGRVKAEQDYIRKLLSLVESGALAELIRKFPATEAAAEAEA